MSSGLLFYWFSWILWIIVTFFMQKNRLRTLLACWILSVILYSNLYISINTFQISVSYLFLLAGTVILYARIPVMIFHVFGSLTIMIGYSAILIWENQMPFNLFFPSFLIISCFLFILITFITTGIWNRLACTLLGMTGGELLYSIVLSEYLIVEVIGDKRFFDFILVLTIAIICQAFLLKFKLIITQKIHHASTASKPLFRKKAQ